MLKKETGWRGICGESRINLRNTTEAFFSLWMNLIGWGQLLIRSVWQTERQMLETKQGWQSESGGGASAVELKLY